MGQNIDLIGEYKINQLYKNNGNIVGELCDKCSDYYILSGGELPTKDNIRELFNDLPPTKDIKDKFTLGVFKSNDLVAVFVK